MRIALLLPLLLLSCFLQAQSYLGPHTQWVETEAAEPLFEGMNKGHYFRSGAINGNRIDVSGLAAGVYYLSVLDGDGNLLHTEKVVKIL